MHSEHSIYAVRRCIGRGPEGSSEPPEPSIGFSLALTFGVICLSRPRADVLDAKLGRFACLGAPDAKVILTPSCIFCIANH
jgi:hypothetical protein